MSTRLDGRPYKIDVTANPEMDSKSLLVSGFPDAYLYAATVTAPIWQLGTTTAAGAAWTVVFDDTTITLSLPQADVELIGQGRYEWALLVEVADGTKPSLIAGTLIVSRDARPSTSVSNVSFTQSQVSAEITIEQIVATGVSVIDGGTPTGSGSDTLDGGTP